MAWYHLFNGIFKKEPTQPRILYCDSPQCGWPIEEGPIVYSTLEREVYHQGQCALVASAHRAFENPGVAVFGDVDYISLDKALRLLQKGRLQQSVRLEEKVSR